MADEKKIRPLPHGAEGEATSIGSGKVFGRQQPDSEPPAGAPRGASVYLSQRYSERAHHLGRIRDVVFNETDVDKAIAFATNNGQETYPILEGRLGDPTKYPGLHSYDGYHRHLRRYTSFHGAADYDGYAIAGDKDLKLRLVDGGYRRSGQEPIPEYLRVFITPGVAGALRLLSEALLLPPNQHVPDLARLEAIRPDLESGLDLRGHTEFLLSVLEDVKRGVKPDNVVIPVWTYVSHLAESFRSHGDVRLCDIGSDGQINLAQLKETIDEHTRVVLFATVGNPLSVAMEPEKFDQVLYAVAEKMWEYGHPIIVVADVIYEQFRRDSDKEIDAIQRALRLGYGVPVVEMSSFSKMMAIPGQRVGFMRILWDPRTFPDERSDFFDTMNYLYWPTLCPVSRHVQRALGDMYTHMRRGSPVEEELAPLAAVLYALKELSEMKGAGHKFPIFSYEETAERIKQMGIPDDYYSHKLIASRTRKIANQVLAGYGVDIHSGKVRELGKKLQDAGLVDVIEKEDLVFYRLREDIPPLKKDDEGQLKLYGISSWAPWEDIAKRCKVPTEDELYREHKKMMREIVHKRVLYFAEKLDEMRREGVGVYLHPTYYDENGRLDPDRLNAFYILWGFTDLKTYSPNLSQAAQFAYKCVELRLPIVACVPGELFVPYELRSDDTSYNRIVALQPTDVMDQQLSIIRKVARELSRG
ncbi:MAG: aminotransferase class I/II-fold pyridoxal phosphate-dependent enzyme [Candidatus Micrarchaeota archaeon]